MLKRLIEQKPKPTFQFTEWRQEVAVEAARLTLQQSLAWQERVSDHVVQMSKWLTGSLLFVNTGAIVAVLNAATHIHHPERPAWLFIAGTLMALLNGWLVQLFSASSVPIATDAVGYWNIVVADNGRRRADVEEILWCKVTNMQKWANLVQVPGWISASLWMIGSLMVSRGFS